MKQKVIILVFWMMAVLLPPVMYAEEPAAEVGGLESISSLVPEKPALFESETVSLSIPPDQFQPPFVTTLLPESPLTPVSEADLTQSYLLKDEMKWFDSCLKSGFMDCGGERLRHDIIKKAPLDPVDLSKDGVFPVREIKLPEIIEGRESLRTPTLPDDSFGIVSPPSNLPQEMVFEDVSQSETSGGQKTSSGEVIMPAQPVPAKKSGRSVGATFSVSVAQTVTAEPISAQPQELKPELSQIPPGLASGQDWLNYHLLQAGSAKWLRKIKSARMPEFSQPLFRKKLKGKRLRPRN